jgi:hypothetical protein
MASKSPAKLKSEPRHSAHPQKAPATLTATQLDRVSGGLEYKLQNCMISNYTISGG